MEIKREKLYWKDKCDLLEFARLTRRKKSIKKRYETWNKLFNLREFPEALSRGADTIKSPGFTSQRLDFVSSIPLPVGTYMR